MRGFLWFVFLGIALTKPAAQSAISPGDLRISASDLAGPSDQGKPTDADSSVTGTGSSVTGTGSSVTGTGSSAGVSGRSGLIRVAAFLIAIVPISLLGVANSLEPNSKGLGTHQQLGLPPCSTRILLGFRCPGCGMTTSWAHFTRGQFQLSARVNTGGFLLAIFSLVVAFLSLRTFWSAQLPSLSTQRNVTLTLVAIAIVTLLDWVMRLIG